MSACECPGLAALSGATWGMPLSRGRVKESWSGKVNEDADAWRRCFPRAGDVFREAEAAAVGTSAAAENAAADVACNCSQAAPCNSASNASGERAGCSIEANHVRNKVMSECRQHFQPGHALSDSDVHCKVGTSVPDRRMCWLELSRTSSSSS